MFLLGHLYPFMARRADLDNEYGRVKLRINGSTANEIVPILDNDPLNGVYGDNFKPKNLLPADFHR